jgi:hypothetical protein
MNDSVIITLATIGSALIGLCVRYAFKSKCSDVALCGCLSVHKCRMMKTHKLKVDKISQDNIKNEMLHFLLMVLM